MPSRRATRSVRLVHRVASLAVAGVAGCANLAPPYERPTAPLPASWNRDRRDNATVDTQAAAGTLDEDLDWRGFVSDPRLAAVVDRALAQNRDVRIAVASIEKAQATYRITEAAARPRLDAGGAALRGRSDGVTTTVYSAAIDAGYQLDLFGRVRNLEDAALAAYLAVRENRRSVAIALVSEVVMAWLTLGADRETVALADRTLRSQEASLDLTRKAHDLGKFTGLDVAQVASTVEAARLQVANFRTRVAQDRNALELLVGGLVVDDELPASLPRSTVFREVPADLPSSVLVARPDVAASERSLQASYANIGVARAAFFPSIALTASGGLQSTALSQLLGGGVASWAIGPSITVPLFDGGLRRADLDSARADRDIAVARYERTLQAAFREVGDVLAARATLVERLAAQRAFAESVATSQRLSEAVFRQGRSDYLSVLTAQQLSYGAQQSLIALRLEDETSRIALYKAFGGTWRPGSPP